MTVDTQVVMCHGRHCVFNSAERHAHNERNSLAQLGYRYSAGSVSLLIWKNISQQSMNYSEYQWLVFGTLLEHFDFTTRNIICLLFYTGLRALVNTLLNSGLHRKRKISLLADRLQDACKTLSVSLSHSLPLSVSLLSPEMKYVWEHRTVVNIWCKWSGTEKRTSTRK
jgi:hypothetical protein